MDAEAYHGTLTSKLKPIVTMLTDALARDFVPRYRSTDDEELWLRVSDGLLVNDLQLKAAVGEWLLNLEHELEDENDKQFAKMCTHMIRKNRGWIDILTERVKRKIA